VHNREKADTLCPIKIQTYTTVKANSAECEKSVTLNGHGIGDASYNTYVFARVGMDIPYILEYNTHPNLIRTQVLAIS